MPRRPASVAAAILDAVPEGGATAAELAAAVGRQQAHLHDPLRALIRQRLLFVTKERRRCRSGELRSMAVYYAAPPTPAPALPPPPPAPRPPAPAPRPPEAPIPFFGTSQEPTWVRADRARRQEEEAEVERLARLLSAHPGESAAALASRLGHVGPPARKGGEPRPLPSRTAMRLEALETAGRALALDPPTAGYARRWRAA